MSVLLHRRGLSKAEYVNTAGDIYDETLNFLSRLSARYSRMMAQQVAELAGKIMDEAAEADSMFPSNRQQVELRRKHLLEARGATEALDRKLFRVYCTLRKNPKGAFARGNDQDQKNKKPFTTDDALRILENMADSLGLKIHNEQNMLDHVMETDQITLREKEGV